MSDVFAPPSLEQMRERLDRARSCHRGQVPECRAILLDLRSDIDTALADGSADPALLRLTVDTLRLMADTFKLTTHPADRPVHEHDVVDELYQIVEILPLLPDTEVERAATLQEIYRLRSSAWPYVYIGAPDCARPGGFSAEPLRRAIGLLDGVGERGEELLADCLCDLAERGGIGVSLHERLAAARRIEGAADRYIEFCKSTFPSHLDLYGLKLVVDTANGAGYHTAPKVFHELGAEVISIGDEPNGYNINDKVGATYTKTLQAAVLQNDADYGIALDGDGDRLMMVDKNGVVYDGDKLIYVIAKARAAQGLDFGGVIGTVMSNLGMEKALAARGIAFARAKVGDRYVLEQLNERGWQIGGEASGHILCMDKHNTGDGIISALQVFAALQVPLLNPFSA